MGRGEGMTMAEFFRSSRVWVVDYLYDGRPRRWIKALPSGSDAPAEMAAQLRELYEGRARLVAVRAATPDEEAQFLRDERPVNVFCPTGRRGPDRG
ncbi:MAG: hypothetical protein LC125_06825 [Burkholderiales bacterium]|nr:hypothetical protein [Burkholderiales bacterium]